jgi:hypothetical protein
MFRAYLQPLQSGDYTIRGTLTVAVTKTSLFDILQHMSIKIQAKAGEITETQSSYHWALQLS